MHVTNVFVDCLKLEDAIKCPGDEGFSEVMVFGRHVKLRKDHPAIELMGRLDELEALAEWAIQEMGFKVFRLIAGMAVMLNTYLATGEEKWLKPIDEVINRACETDVKELGWFVPTNKVTVLLNILRVKAREAERTAVKLIDVEELPRENTLKLIKALNQLNKYIAHLIYERETHIYRSVDEKLHELLR